MMRSIATGLAVLGLSVMPLTGAARAPAPVQALTETPVREAAEICRQADSVKALKEMGLTRAECVGAIIGPRTDEAISDIVTLCRVEKVQETVGALHTRHCVERIQDLLIAGA